MQKKAMAMTESQLHKINYIKEWFQGYFRRSVLARFETIYQDNTGFVYVAVETTDNILTTDGGFFVIGRRGGIRVLDAVGMSREIHDRQFYADRLSGKVGW